MRQRGSRVAGGEKPRCRSPIDPIVPAHLVEQYSFLFTALLTNPASALISPPASFLHPTSIQLFPAMLCYLYKGFVKHVEELNK